MDELMIGELLAWALLAGFILYKLWSVLGRRHGEERQRPNPYAAPGPMAGLRGAAQTDEPAAVRPKDSWAAVTAAPEAPLPLEQVLVRIKTLEPSFDEKAFLRGARGAFELIVKSFAQGDRATLQPLLSPALFRTFVEAIEARPAGEQRSVTVTQIRDIGIIRAELSDGVARLTVSLVSDQDQIVRDADGNLVPDETGEETQITDCWTFERRLGTPDPAWLLVKTEA